MCDLQSQKGITLVEHVNTKHAVSTKVGPETYEYNRNVTENIEPVEAKFVKSVKNFPKISTLGSFILKKFTAWRDPTGRFDSAIVSCY